MRIVPVYAQNSIGYTTFRRIRNIYSKETIQIEIDFKKYLFVLTANCFYISAADRSIVLPDELLFFETLRELTAR